MNLTRERLENTMDVLKIKFGPIKGFSTGQRPVSRTPAKIGLSIFIFLTTDSDSAAQTESNGIGLARLRQTSVAEKNFTKFRNVKVYVLSSIYFWEILYRKWKCHKPLLTMNSDSWELGEYHGRLKMKFGLIKGFLQGSKLVFSPFLSSICS